MTNFLLPVSRVNNYQCLAHLLHTKSLLDHTPANPTLSIATSVVISKCFSTINEVFPHQ